MKLPQRTLWAFTGSFLLCAIAGCGSRSKPAQSASDSQPVNPCSVLSAADIQSTLGAAPQSAGKRDNETVTDDCDWTLPSGAEVHVTFFNAVGAAKFYTPQVSSKRPNDKTYDSVSGLGDQAVYRDESSKGISVSESVEVVKGQQHFDLHYVDAIAKTAGPSKDAMVSLARKVVAHVP
jgi:hypothetical protein